jgi:single-stranded-DNA-specific exonuclease
MKPVFCTRNLVDFEGKSRLVGKDNTHLKLILADIHRTHPKSCIAFCSGEMRDYNMSDILKHIQTGGKIDICYTFEENTFNGITEMQLMIKDIEIKP